MKSVFERIVDLEAIKDIPLAEYSAKELCAYILHTYPKDPLGALNLMREKLEIGNVLGEQTELLLEGFSKC
jgi:hypothetical protein